MVTQISSPRFLTTRWRAAIQQIHNSNFEFYLGGVIDNHWWFADIKGGQLRGIAGAKKDTDTEFFLGPCVVMEPYRGLGIQRDFMSAREELGRGLGYEWAVSYTFRENFASANNFIRCGYRLTAPWLPDYDTSGTYLYWRKRLNQPGG
jgi:GNAT superfamily N-acetyltransferase